MVSKKKALKISGLSAVAVGVVHWLAHMIFKTQPIEQQVIYVGLSVVLAVFLIGYFGMSKKR